MIDPDSGQARLCTGDINGSGAVEVTDLLRVIQTWGACDVCPPDIVPMGGNSVVNADDLLGVINNWGACK
jgi:hypothetical protein